MKRTFATIAILVMVVVSAYSQQDAVMKTKIPFSFMAGQKMLPAGNYEFTVATDRSSIAVRNLDTGAVADLSVMTRLAPNSVLDQPKITFDEINGTVHLEALWPRIDDGYLLGMTKEKHTHKTVKIG